MNPKAQYDVHPDADLLNAFAEHALPEAERARILAHVAECGRCREVAFLARAAAEAPIAPTPARTSGVRPGWFSSAFAKWRVTLIPAAALAAVGTVVLWVRLHPAPAGVQMAQMTAPPSAPASSVTAMKAPQPSAETHPDRSLAAPPPAGPSPVKMAPGRRPPRAGAAPGSAANELLAQNKPAAPPVQVMDEQRRAFGAVHLDGHSAKLAMQAPPVEAPDMMAATAQTNPQRQTAAPHTPATDPFMTQAAPAPVPAPSSNVSMHGAAMGPATGGPQALSSSAVQSLVLTPETTNGLAMMRLARRPRLPSGLNAVSSAAMLNRLVALDSAGGLFLSPDGGKHWEPVSAQWSGKAIAVQGPPDHVYRVNAAPDFADSDAPTESAAVEGDKRETVESPPAATLKAKVAPPVPPMLFRLVTDRHQTWVSTDGKTWREQ